tara:strand:- start:180 stop:377 length:198 start_codon:yes stop_codon:yes gene_type:complete
MEIKLEMYGIDLKVKYDLDEDYFVDEINEVKVKGVDILDLLSYEMLGNIEEQIYLTQAKLSDEAR